VNETIWYYSRVIDGKIKLLNRQGFDQIVKSLDGMEVDVGLRKHRKARTLRQNSYLWFMYGYIAERIDGHTKDTIHEAMGILFRLDRTGPIPTVKSTTAMSTVEMNEYVERIHQFCAETLDIVVPDPNSEEALQWSQSYA
jgi:hypothetical protein